MTEAWIIALVGIIAGPILGAVIGNAVSKARINGMAEEIVRLRDRVHDHASLLHGLKGHVEMLQQKVWK